MKIIPEAHNAIKIKLEDGKVYSIRHSIHGNQDCLFISGDSGALTVTDYSGMNDEVMGLARNLKITQD